MRELSLELVDLGESCPRSDLPWEAGADPGILVRGAWIFFSKALGLGVTLRPPMGPGQCPGGGQGGKAPGSS